MLAELRIPTRNWLRHMWRGRQEQKSLTCRCGLSLPSPPPPAFGRAPARAHAQALDPGEGRGGGWAEHPALPEARGGKRQRDARDARTGLEGVRSGYSTAVRGV